MGEIVAKVKFVETRKTYDYFIPKGLLDNSMVEKFLTNDGWKEVQDASAVVDVHGDKKLVKVVALGHDYNVKHWATRDLYDLFLGEFSVSKEESNEKINNNKRGSKMKNNLFGNFGEKVEGVFAFSVFDGSPAYKLSDKWVTYKDGGLIDANDFVMEMDIPRFYYASYFRPN